MSTDVHIRQAGAADIPLLTDLIRVSFQDVAGRFRLTAENCPNHPSNCSEEWIERDLARGVFYYILESNGNPAGCVALEKTQADIVYLERLGVLPGYRRNGFGRALVKHCITAARSLGAQEISIGIIAGNTELKQWYQTLGFVERETKEFNHLPFLVTFMTYTLWVERQAKVQII
jgi:N-acetylglutamate synthase-like GNAT family acetyltransferase